MTATPGASSAERASREGGFVLIFVLGVLVLLAVLAASVQLKAQLDARARRALNASAELTAAVDGVVRLMAFRLGEQRGGATVPLPLYVDGRDFGCLLGDVAVAVRVQDQAGLIDLNMASQATLERLIAFAGAANASELAAAIVDYRDTDDVALNGGSEARAYLGAGLSHGAKNAPFEAIEELDQVIGMTSVVLERVLPLVTVHASGAIDPAVAPVALRTALALPEQARAPTGAQIRPGDRGRARLFGIDVTGRRGDAVRGRRAIVEFVDRPGAGFVVRSWASSHQQNSLVQMSGNPPCE
jgi:general secretion pathway protein K